MGLTQKEENYPMKKFFILFAAAALMLCTCGTDAASTSEPPDQKTELEAYTAFLNGSGEAFLSYGGTCRDISQVLCVPEDMP